MLEKHYVTWKEIQALTSKWPRNKKYYGVPRGGQAVAAYMNPVDTPEEADIIVDDLIDSGATAERYLAKYPNKQFYALIDKREEAAPKWYVFPWEETDPATDIESHVRRFIQSFDDCNREGLLDTPRRYVKFMREFLSPPEFNFTTFSNDGMDEMIVVRDIPFYSLCEHHLAPFFGTAHIAYIPTDKIVGISKLPRTLDLYARRLQNQERITHQVAHRLNQELHPQGVAVVLSAEHLCMAMRGVKKPHAKTVTSTMLGVFKTDINARNEFLKLIE